MPIVQIEIDTEKAMAVGAKVFSRLQKVEELYPDSVAVQKLHKALEEMQAGLLAKFPEGSVTAFSGGGKSDPPDDDDGEG